MFNHSVPLAIVVLKIDCNFNPISLDLVSIFQVNFVIARFLNICYCERVLIAISGYHTGYCKIAESGASPTRELYQSFDRCIKYAEKGSCPVPVSVCFSSNRIRCRSIFVP